MSWGGGDVEALLLATIDRLLLLLLMTLITLLPLALVPMLKILWPELSIICSGAAEMTVL